MPLSDRPNPTDPGDAADLSIPWGMSEVAFSPWRIQTHPLCPEGDNS